MNYVLNSQTPFDTYKLHGHVDVGIKEMRVAVTPVVEGQPDCAIEVSPVLGGRDRIEQRRDATERARAIRQASESVAKLNPARAALEEARAGDPATPLPAISVAIELDRSLVASLTANVLAIAARSTLEPRASPSAKASSTPPTPSAATGPATSPTAQSARPTTTTRGRPPKC